MVKPFSGTNNLFGKVKDILVPNTSQMCLCMYIICKCVRVLSPSSSHSHPRFILFLLCTKRLTSMNYNLWPPFVLFLVVFSQWEARAEQKAEECWGIYLPHLHPLSLAKVLLVAGVFWALDGQLTFTAPAHTASFPCPSDLKEVIASQLLHLAHTSLNSPCKTLFSSSLLSLFCFLLGPWMI